MKLIERKTEKWETGEKTPTMLRKSTEGAEGMTLDNVLVTQLRT